MTFVDWAQIASAAAATVAAGLAAFTTFLSFKQLRYQFSPRLHISGEIFQVRMHDSSLEKLFWERPTPEGAFQNGGTFDYRFRLINTGAGAAQDVTIVTEFDVEAAYKDVVQKLAHYAPTLEIVQEEWGAKVSIGNRHIGGFKNPDQAYGYLDYVRPCKDERVEAPFIIDPTLSFFSLVFGYYLMKEQIEKGISQPEQYIDVDFVIKCTDAGGTTLIRRHPHRLVVSGGRWKADATDGVILVSLRRR